MEITWFLSLGLVLILPMMVEQRRFRVWSQQPTRGHSSMVLGPRRIVLASLRIYSSLPFGVESLQRKILRSVNPWLHMAMIKTAESSASIYLSILDHFQSAVLWPKPSQGRCTTQSPSYNSSEPSSSFKN